MYCLALKLITFLIWIVLRLRYSLFVTTWGLNVFVRVQGNKPHTQIYLYLARGFVWSVECQAIQSPQMSALSTPETL